MAEPPPELCENLLCQAADLRDRVSGHHEPVVAHENDMGQGAAALSIPGELFVHELCKAIPGVRVGNKERCIAKERLHFLLRVAGAHQRVDLIGMGVHHVAPVQHLVQGAFHGRPAAPARVGAACHEVVLDLLFPLERLLAVGPGKNPANGGARKLHETGLRDVAKPYSACLDDNPLIVLDGGVPSAGNREVVSFPVEPGNLYEIFQVHEKTLLDRP